jgi:hypothetical protein
VTAVYCWSRDMNPSVSVCMKLTMASTSILLAVKSVNSGSSPGPLRGGIHCISPCRETNRTPLLLRRALGRPSSKAITTNSAQLSRPPMSNSRRPVMMRLTKAKGPRSGGGAVLSGSDLVLTVTPGGQSLAKAIRVIRRMGCGSNRQKIFFERQSPRCSMLYGGG